MVEKAADESSSDVMRWLSLQSKETLRGLGYGDCPQTEIAQIMQNESVMNVEAQRVLGLIKGKSRDSLLNYLRVCRYRKKKRSTHELQSVEIPIWQVQRLNAVARKKGYRDGDLSQAISFLLAQAMM